MTDRCPACNQKLPEMITVEYVTGEHVATYWTNETYWGKSAYQAALDRIRGLKPNWGIDARIREVAE